MKLKNSVISDRGLFPFLNNCNRYHKTALSIVFDCNMQVLGLRVLKQQKQRTRTHISVLSFDHFFFTNSDRGITTARNKGIIYKKVIIISFVAYHYDSFVVLYRIRCSLYSVIVLHTGEIGLLMVATSFHEPIHKSSD